MPVADRSFNRQKLIRLQALLYAEHKHSLLIVLQAMDAGGKDGTINHVFAAFNPQGTTVTGFKQPTLVERGHDFLWRVHPHVPGPGEVAIFNRSHYEDVLVTRVHKLIDEATCKARYEQIRGFERGLADSGTCILKFFLHISREEQLARFAERLQDPARNWKISESDYTERDLWDDYIAAFEDAMEATSTSFVAVPVGLVMVSVAVVVAAWSIHAPAQVARIWTDLLDWLACEFVDSGWDVKHIVRLIVTSKTATTRIMSPGRE